MTDDEAAEAVRFLLLRMKLLVEPSGAAPIAALLAGKDSERAGQEDRRGVVRRECRSGEVGGNIDE